jgi:transposase
VLNAKVINIFLAQMSRELATDVHAVLIWDGAGYHTAKEVKVPENITLLQLPPYSPELNPMENLWHYARSHYWSNRFYADYDELFDAASDGWRTVCLNTELVKSICSAPYLSRNERAN